MRIYCAVECVHILAEEKGLGKWEVEKDRVNINTSPSDPLAVHRASAKSIQSVLPCAKMTTRKQDKSFRKTGHFILPSQCNEHTCLRA